MELDDYIATEVLVAIAATAAVVSKPGRRLLRRAAVYGLAGALIAGGAVTSFGHGVVRGVRDSTSMGAGPEAGSDQPAA
jgi:hypothetical protein